MAVVRAAAYGHGHAAQLRVAQQLYRGIKAVAVAVKDHALFFRQIRRPPLRNSTGRFTAGTFSTQLSVCAPALRRRRAVRPGQRHGRRLCGCCRPAPACKFSALLTKIPVNTQTAAAGAGQPAPKTRTAVFCFVRRKIFLCGPALRIVRRRPRFLLLIITFCSIIQNT